MFIRTLGKLECENFKKITNKYKLNKECKLQYDFTLNKYYLFVVFDGEQKNINDLKQKIEGIQITSIKLDIEENNCFTIKI